MAAADAAAPNSGEGMTNNNSNHNNNNNNNTSLLKKSSFRLRSSSLNSVRLRRVFDIFDANGDGFITADEIGKALVLLGLEDSDDDPSGSAIDSIISSFVKPGNQGLTFDDFVALHSAVNDTVVVEDHGLNFEDADEGDELDDRDRVLSEEEEDRTRSVTQEDADLTEAFKVFDEDGDGYISAKELQVVLDKLGLPEAREMERVERMISSVDQNHDGLVDFFEFKDMMRSVMGLTNMVPAGKNSKLPTEIWKDEPRQLP